MTMASSAVNALIVSILYKATPDEVSQYIHPHPTLSETFGETVMSLTGRGLHG